MYTQNAGTSKNKLAQLETKGKIIEFPVAMAFLNTQSHLTHMFVREPCLTIYNNAREHGLANNLQLCITGTPGTGKFALGVYCFLGEVLEAVKSENIAVRRLAIQNASADPISRHCYSFGAFHLIVDSHLDRTPKYSH